MQKDSISQIKRIFNKISFIIDNDNLDIIRADIYNINDTSSGAYCEGELC